MYSKPWNILSSSIQDCGGIFKVRKDRVLMPKNGKEYSVYSLCLSNWVNVIALTSDYHVVMVKQYRHGIRDFTIELPGGVIDSGDTPIEAAKRELLEETGYIVDDFTLLGKLYPNPAIQVNECYTFFGKNARLVSNQDLDELEDIEVVTVPMKEIPGMIERGVINHGLIIAAFCFLFVKYPELIVNKVEKI